MNSYTTDQAEDEAVRAELGRFHDATMLLTPAGTLAGVSTFAWISWGMLNHNVVIAWLAAGLINAAWHLVNAVLARRSTLRNHLGQPRFVPAAHLMSGLVWGAAPWLPDALENENSFLVCPGVFDRDWGWHRSSAIWRQAAWSTNPERTTSNLSHGTVTTPLPLPRQCSVTR
jgi:hypothetical protein